MRRAEPYFSICIPCFNHADYIGRTIESVLAQTYPNYEVVVVDNASTDGSADVVAGFDSPRIRLFRNPRNIGFAANCQEAARRASGEFLTLLSSDDLMAPNVLENYAHAIEAHPTDRQRLVLSSDAYQIDANDHVTAVISKTEDGRRNVCLDPKIYTQVPSPVRLDASSLLQLCLRTIMNWGVFCTVTYHRHLYEQTGGYYGLRHIYPDKHFHWKLLSENPAVLHFRQPLFSLRRHGQNQNDIALQGATLKHLLDNYSSTFDTDPKVLEAAGVRPDDIAKCFVQRDCLDAAVRLAANGQLTRGWRAFAFGLAAYPDIWLRSARTWGILPILCLGYLGIPFAKVWRRWMLRRAAPKNGAARTRPVVPRQKLSETEQTV